MNINVQFEPSKVKQTKPRAYLVRFIFGGLITALSGYLTTKFGVAVGGLFLGFPAILSASLTLVKKHEGEEAAGDDALGAVAGSIGLVAFGVIVWRLSDTLAAWLALTIAAIVWLGLSIAVWLLARRLKRRQ